MSYIKFCQHSDIVQTIIWSGMCDGVTNCSKCGELVYDDEDYNYQPEPVRSFYTCEDCGQFMGDDENDIDPTRVTGQYYCNDCLDQ